MWFGDQVIKGRLAFGSFTLREVTCHVKKPCGKAHVVRNSGLLPAAMWVSLEADTPAPVKSSETTALADNFPRDLLRESEPESLS